ncbi:hypothetical protein ABKV19_012975 [Rosa sericea]
MAKKPVKFSVVDAFTESAFKGNPAAVCLLEEDRDDKWHQALAAEFNLSETCYLSRLTDSVSDPALSSTPARFRLRWFTPVTEVDLCGHATLAAASTLFKSGLVSTDPSNEFNSADASLISNALGGASVIDIRRTTVTDDLLVLLPSGKAVVDLQPQYDEIKKCPGTRGVIVTAVAPPESGYDFYSRFFCPTHGIDEDPVCGSAHCALASYWCNKLGKCDLVAYAASPRGGTINIHLDEQNQRVLLRGKAVTVMEGTVLV